MQTFSFPCATATKRPTCKSKSCESLAQTGYDSYCKLCYKKLFAALYKEKQLQRLKHCTQCKQLRELSSAGLCKPCTRQSLKPMQSCGHCNQNATGRLGVQKTCSETSCNAIFSLCASCQPHFRAQKNLQCRACWHASDDLCVACNLHRAQHNLDKYRCCRTCITKITCKQCMLRPPPDLETATCLACENLALWCVEHCSNTEIQSGLCATHFEKLFGACQYCFQVAEDSELLWKPCSIDGCLRSVRVCEKCVSCLEDPSLICEPCWRAKGSLCVICQETPSQTHFGMLVGAKRVF